MALEAAATGYTRQRAAAQRLPVQFRRYTVSFSDQRLSNGHPERTSQRYGHGVDASDAAHRPNNASRRQTIFAIGAKTTAYETQMSRSGGSIVAGRRGHPPAGAVPVGHEGEVHTRVPDASFGRRSSCTTSGRHRGARGKRDCGRPLRVTTADRPGRHRAYARAKGHNRAIARLNGDSIARTPSRARPASCGARGNRIMLAPYVRSYRTNPRKCCLGPPRPAPWCQRHVAPETVTT